MSIHSYTRTFTGEVPDVNVRNLTNEIKVALPGMPFSIQAHGTSVDCDFTATLSAGEITTLDDTVATHKANQPAALNDLFIDKYREQEYSNSLLTKETSYAKKEGDGSYSFKVWEHTYSYSGHVLISRTENTYDVTGAITNTSTWNFS